MAITAGQSILRPFQCFERLHWRSLEVCIQIVEAPAPRPSEIFGARDIGARSGSTPEREKAGDAPREREQCEHDLGPRLRRGHSGQLWSSIPGGSLCARDQATVTTSGTVAKRGHLSRQNFKMDPLS